MGSMMGDEISEHYSVCHKKRSCKILWVPIMPGTQILWVPVFFIYIFHNSLLLLILGSRGWKKSKDCLSSRKKYACSRD
jgi:hypothetical protein